MKKHTEAEQFAENVLASIDNIEAVEVNEFLFTRIQNRLEQKNSVLTNEKTKVLYRLAALLVVFIAINAASFFLFKHTAATANQQTAGLAAFASEYKLEQGSYNY